MNATLLIVFLVVMLSLALLPWANRAWQAGRGRSSDHHAEDAKRVTPDSHQKNSKSGTDPSTEFLVPPTSFSIQEKLSKARGFMSERLGKIRHGSVEGSTWDNLEELLILADVGVDATMDTGGMQVLGPAPDKLHHHYSANVTAPGVTIHPDQ